MKNWKRVIGMILAIQMILVSCFTALVAYAQETDPELLAAGYEEQLTDQILQTVPTHEELETASLQGSLWNWAGITWEHMSGHALEAADDTEETKILVSGMLPEGAWLKGQVIRLQEDYVNNETCLYAYRISAYDKDGNVYVPEEGNLEVTISSPLINEAIAKGFFIQIYTDMLYPAAHYHNNDAYVSEAGVNFSVPVLPCSLLVTVYDPYHQLEEEVTEEPEAWEEPEYWTDNTESEIVYPEDGQEATQEETSTERTLYFLFDPETTAQEEESLITEETEETPVQEETEETEEAEEAEQEETSAQEETEETEEAEQEETSAEEETEETEAAEQEETSAEEETEETEATEQEETSAQEETAEAEEQEETTSQEEEAEDTEEPAQPETEAETENEAETEDDVYQLNQLIFVNRNVFVTGMMPADAIVEAVPVDVEIDGEVVLAAYDIAIYENEEKQAEGDSWQPQEDEVQVHIVDQELKQISNEEVSVYGLSDAQAEAEISGTAQIRDEEVVVDAGESSIVIVTRKLLEKSIAMGGNTWHVTVLYDTAAGIPDGAELVVSEVNEEDYLEETARTLDWTEDDEILYTRFLDISIMYEGEEIEPKTPVEVLIELLDVEDGTEDVQVVHFTDEGAETIDSSSEDTLVSFAADSFSVYGFSSVLKSVAKEETDEAALTVLTSGKAPELSGAQPETEEGTEVLAAYTVDESNSKLWLKAVLNEDAELAERESVTLCTVQDNTVTEVILEEVSLEKQMVQLDPGAEGFALVKDSGYRRMDLELVPEAGEGNEPNSDDSATVTLSGMLPKDASAEAQDVTAQFDGSEFQNEEEEAGGEKTPVAAYDITILENEDTYQPDEEHPVDVTIINSAILPDRELEIWHLKDDGSKEQITEFEVTEGQIRFEAAGFSVYAIVQGPEPVVPEVVTAKNLNELPGDGFYLSITKSGKGTCYFQNTLNAKSCISRTGNGEIAKAAVWYLEPEEGQNRYSLYTLIDGNKTYMKAVGTNGMELSETDKTVFEVSLFTPGTEGFFLFKVAGQNHYLNFSGSGDGFKCYGTANEDCKVVLTYPPTLGDDPYELDGKTYGLMNYTGGTSGTAMMAGSSKANALNAVSLLTRLNPLDRTDHLYVAKDSQISLWTFHDQGNGYYLVSADTADGTKYLQLTNSGLALSDAENATKLQVIPGTGSNAGKIRLSAGPRTVSYKGSVNNGFGSDPDSASSWKQWLNLVDLSELTEEDFVIYSASKVSVSDEQITNGSRIIIYTRTWNDVEKHYEFYAIDHNGELVPCFESGDSIQWIGTRVNTLLWNFTEYYYEGTNKPNYYYELKNPYSGNYLAPQIRDGQILSDSTIGLNLNGRKYQDYYSTILAWDDPYYAFAGLKVENGKIVSCPMAQAEDFYFAIMQDITEETLTPVPTVDHTQYGITMKVVNFDSNVTQNTFLGSSAGGLNVPPTQGLLSTQLGEDGYPTAAGGSMGSLFAGGQEVNHLFIGSTYSGTGYYEFDSTQNFASLQGSDFVVYKELGTMDASSRVTLKHGQFMPFNDLTAGVFASLNDENLYTATQEMLSEDDPRKGEKLLLVQQPDYYFGLEIEASFVQTPNGLDAWGHDIIYEFTGDDDFWLYVDGELIIDLGGIHSALPGKVNYSTGEVEVYNTKTTLRAVFEQNFRKRNPKASDQDVAAYLAEYFEEGSTIFKDYTTHTMRIFFMERGAGASNLHMRFNLASVKPGQILLNKKISGTDKEDYNLAEYGYQIWYRTRFDTEFQRLTETTKDQFNVTYQNRNVPARYEERFTPAGGNTVYEDVFFLNPGETVAITVPDETIEYYIVEVGVNNQVYDKVKVNDEELEGTPTLDETRMDFQTSAASVAQRQRVVFDNHVNPSAMRTLTITKKLFETDGETPINDDPVGFTFRLYLGKENDTELKAAELQDYCVKDPEGNYCRWDYGKQTFVSLGKTSFEELTPDEQLLAVFTTSINGSISKIPANYRVEVRDLLVGTRFRVEERETDIPAGYTFLQYLRDSDSYIVEDGDTENSGIIRDSQSPAIEIHNKRGFGLTGRKVWSDAGYMNSHGDVYFAVYVNDNLLEGTVRRIAHPGTSVYYYFDELAAGAGLADYKICEVLPAGDFTVAEDGTVVGASSVTRLEEGEHLTITAETIAASEEDAFVYSVSYARGEVGGTADNVKTDTVTNTRSGIRLMKQNWNGQALSGAQFTLTDSNGTPAGEGSFTSDTNGLITIAYLRADEDYILTETKAPKGYYGLQAPLTIRLESSGNIVVSSAESESDSYAVDQADGDSMADVIIKNRPVFLSAVKLDAKTQDALADAHFALYRQVSYEDGTYAPDYLPMTGFADLVSGENGVIPKIDQTLAVGSYYLHESKSPEGYEVLEEDILFTIHPTGKVTLESNPAGVRLEERISENGAFSYVLAIPNGSTANLTVTKTVTGDLGDRTREFTFALSFANEADFESYSYQKYSSENGADEEPLTGEGASGTLTADANQFTLAHGQKIVIEGLPRESVITITEMDADGYEVSFRLDGQDMETSDNAAALTLTDDVQLDVVNDLNAVSPTDVRITTSPFGLMLLAGLILLSVLAGSFWFHRRKDD